MAGAVGGSAGSIDSHPSRKYKNAARVGHPYSHYRTTFLAQSVKRLPLDHLGHLKEDPVGLRSLRKDRGAIKRGNGGIDAQCGRSGCAD